MSDPYSGAAFTDPQSIAICSQARESGRAQSFRSRQRSAASSDDPAVAALRKWDVLPSPAIQVAIVDYYAHQGTPEQLRRMEGLQQSFELAQLMAGMWLSAGPNLCLNTLSGQIELDGAPITEKQGQLLLRNKAWCYGRLPTYEEMEAYGVHHPYSPVARYLLSLEAGSEDPLAVLHELGRRALGVSDSLSLAMVAKTLIGAVARALEPGCDHQSCLVLQGPQGIGKTSFFAALFGKEFFGHLDTNRDQRDWAMAMASRWCVELGELEAFTSKKSAGMLKNFLSASIDTYRRPYERSPRTIKRHSICVGSVNVGCPLVDETGNRRYWMVSVERPIDVAWVRQQRDRLWAAAVSLFQQGEPWWFDGETESQVVARAENYRQSHPWEEVLAELLPALAHRDGEHQGLSRRVQEMLFAYGGQGYPTSADLLDLLGIPVDRQTRRDSNQLGVILRSLGWSLKTVKVQGRSKKVWAPSGA